jgi:diguanylate cyclase
LAKILKNSVRGNDVPSRFGGEEFTVLLPDTPLEGALKVAEKVRKIVAAQNLRYDDTDLGRVTASIGVAQIRIDDNSKSLFERADSALYKAKKSGRNKVCSA